MKNIHPNKLFKSLIHLNKYHLIPNSLYSCVDKVNPVIFIHLKTNNKPFGTLRIRVNHLSFSSSKILSQKPHRIINDYF